MADDWMRHGPTLTAVARWLERATNLTIITPSAITGMPRQ
jgi:hypothetical protein